MRVDASSLVALVSSSYVELVVAGRRSWSRSGSSSSSRSRVVVGRRS
ncbi:hypothetical protein ACXZ9C_11475 [Streptococcus agalactiae]